jgi:hypothetical protein
MDELKKLLAAKIACQEGLELAREAVNALTVGDDVEKRINADIEYARAFTASAKADEAYWQAAKNAAAAS